MGKKSKQNPICVACGRQFSDHYEPPKGYSDEVKRECLKLYVNSDVESFGKSCEVHTVTDIQTFTG